MLVVMAIHNLSISSKGFSYHGYFHWRTHICNFIEKNWNYLIGSHVKRKKKWTGTISGSLSTNAPAMFTSGLELLKDTGWWKLTYNYNPKQYMDLCKTLILNLLFVSLSIDDCRHLTKIGKEEK